MKTPSVKLLAGSRRQVDKAEIDAPVQICICALPGWVP